MDKSKRIFRTWIPFAVVISAFCLLVYAAIQQEYRQDANDPQIQMANDAADALFSGQSLDSVVPLQKVSVVKSLAPFLIVYDKNGNELAASVTLDGKTPQLPGGVLDSTQKLGENRVTWEPKDGVRIAAVIVSYSDGFVLGGRNLREVEVRESQVSSFAGITWIVTLIVTLIVITLGELFLVDME